MFLFLPEVSVPKGVNRGQINSMIKAGFLSYWFNTSPALDQLSLSHSNSAVPVISLVCVVSAPQSTSGWLLQEADEILMLATNFAL